MSVLLGQSLPRRRRPHIPIGAAAHRSGPLRALTPNPNGRHGHICCVRKTPMSTCARCRTLGRGMGFAPRERDDGLIGCRLHRRQGGEGDRTSRSLSRGCRLTDRCCRDGDNSEYQSANHSATIRAPGPKGRAARCEYSSPKPVGGSAPATCDAEGLLSCDLQAIASVSASLWPNIG